MVTNLVAVFQGTERFFIHLSDTFRFSFSGFYNGEAGRSVLFVLFDMVTFQVGYHG